MAPSIPAPHHISDASALSTTCGAHGLTEAEFAELHRRCVAAKATAYCPYSRFRVGATVLSSEGENEEEREGEQEGRGGEKKKNRYFDGANVENASYPVTTCAERVAIARAVTEGRRRLRAVAVATDIAPPASPCGMCRQFIREFSDLDTPVIMFDKDDNYIVMSLEELLPVSFGPDVLPPPESLPKF